MKPHGEKQQKVKPNFFLHCDECHHEVDFDGWMGREHVGYPCPVCCADMLTEADYKVGRRIQWVMRFFQFIGLMKPANRNTQPAGNEELVQFHHHAGRTTVTKLDG